MSLSEGRIADVLQRRSSVAVIPKPIFKGGCVGKPPGQRGYHPSVIKGYDPTCHKQRLGVLRRRDPSRPSDDRPVSGAARPSISELRVASRQYAELLALSRPPAVASPSHIANLTASTNGSGWRKAKARRPVPSLMSRPTGCFGYHSPLGSLSTRRAKIVSAISSTSAGPGSGLDTTTSCGTVRASSRPRIAPKFQTIQPGGRLCAFSQASRSSFGHITRPSSPRFVIILANFLPIVLSNLLVVVPASDELAVRHLAVDELGDSHMRCFGSCIDFESKFWEPGFGDLDGADIRGIEVKSGCSQPRLRRFRFFA